MPRSPRYLTRFTCLAERCPDSCCVSTHIGINRREHASLTLRLGNTDQDRRELAEKVAIAPLQRRLLEYASLRRTPEGRCTFLQPDALCSLQARFGEHALPNTCAAFPRALLSGPEGPELSASLACPEIARGVVEEEDAFEEVEVEPIRLTWARYVAEGGSAPDSPFVLATTRILREVGTLAEKLALIADAHGASAGTAALDVPGSFRRVFELRAAHPANERFSVFARQLLAGATPALPPETVERTAGRVARHAWTTLRLQHTRDPALAALWLALRAGLARHALAAAPQGFSPADVVQLCARYLEKHPVLLDVFGGLLRESPEVKLAAVRAIAEHARQS